jgi:hypothetical protein
MEWLKNLFGGKTAPTSTEIESMLTAKRAEASAAIAAADPAGDDAAWDAASQRAGRLQRDCVRLEEHLKRVREREAAEAKSVSEKRLSDHRAANARVRDDAAALAAEYVELDRQLAKLNARRDALVHEGDIAHFNLQMTEVDLGLRHNQKKTPPASFNLVRSTIRLAITEAQRQEGRLDFGGFEQLRPLA